MAGRKRKLPTGKAQKSKVVRERRSEIVIDKSRGWTFANEDELYAYFARQIDLLENEYLEMRSAYPEPESLELQDFEELLGMLLDDPDEVWEDAKTIPGEVLTVYMGEYQVEHRPLYYLAVTHHVPGEGPTFVFLHFPTSHWDLAKVYRRGHLVYSRLSETVALGAAEGDALSEGDEWAAGLYQSMMMVRAEKDIPEKDFKDYVQYREMTIENSDEIWRHNDFRGNVLVNFVRDLSEEIGSEIYYVVVTMEDGEAGSHALLFSFPTNDVNLVDRYRRGENLHAEEVVQESSH